MATITGTNGNDTLADTAARESIDAGAGDDIVTINFVKTTGYGEGRSINGGDGFDTLIFKESGEGVWFDASVGSASVSQQQGIYTTYLPFTGFERYNVDIYASERQAFAKTGSGDDIIRVRGFDGATVYAGAGNDRIEVPDESGIFGINLNGEAGDDTYYVRYDAAFFYRQVLENPNEGIDTLYWRGINNNALFTLPDNVEYFYYTGSQVTSLRARGNVESNLFVSNSSLATFDADMSDGGNDTVRGSTGADTIRYSNTFNAQDSVDGGAGSDTLILTGNLASGVQVFNVTGVELTQLSGGSFNFTALGSVSSAQAVTTIDGSALTAAETLSFDAHLETVGSFAITGGASNDALYGGSQADTLRGGSGNDVLAGNGGANLLIGGTGDDIYVVASAADIITEQAFEGYDTVYASASYTLSGNSAVEALSTQSQQDTDNINLIGNYYAQQVIGNFGNNVLNGNGGADTLIGLRGNDIYAVADASAVIVENPGEGHDIVYTSVGYTLTGLAEIEELSFATQAGTENMNIIGNGYNQNVVGNFGNNVLNGNGGIDTLIGLRGDDIYVVGDQRSVVQELSGQGYDVVYASTSYSLASGASIEVLSTQTASETVAIDFKGNAISQRLIGNNGANILDGGEGADTLQGLGGADIFAFSAAPGMNNADIVADFQSGVDSIQLSSSVFTGLSIGTLAASAFMVGSWPATAEQRIIYDQSTGSMFYDRDGTGQGSMELFASFIPNTQITAAMITVV